MADISTDIAQWSGTAGSNSPTGGTSIGTGLDDNLRAMQAAVVLALNSKGTDKASAGTVDLSATDGLFHDVTGTTTITAFGTVRAGVWKVLKFEGALTLTHNATSLIIPGGANVITANGDMCMVTSEGSGNWRVNWYVKATSGVLPVGFGMSPITASLGADVDLNNTANYFDGPSVAQGSSGTWFVSGTVVVLDTSACNLLVKLWDGTTLIASSSVFQAAGAQVAIALSGYLASPAGNLRISVRDGTNTSGKIKFNNSGLSKDSTISAIRIA